MSEVIIPPDQSKAAQVVRIEATQKNIEYFQRACVREVLSKLNNQLQDAALEIAKARYMYDVQGAGRYQTVNLANARGYSGGEWGAYMLTILNRYDVWKKGMQKNPQTLSITLNFCQHEISIDALRKFHRISERLTLKRLQWGLNEYAIIAGWGNQIEGAVK